MLAFTVISLQWDALGRCMWFPCITENEMHYTVPFCKSLYANKFCKAGVLENFQIHIY